MMLFSAGVASKALLLVMALLPLTHSDMVTWQKCKDKNNLTERALGWEKDFEATILNLGECDINDIDYYSLDNAPNMKKIILHNNNIRVLVGSMFKNVAGLEEFDLSNNNIEFAPQFGYYNLFHNLTKYYLQNNLINGLCHLDHFSCMGKLEILNLESNVIGFIHPKMFKDLVSLKEIYLGYNDLAYIPDELFQIKTLEKVYLNDNQIQYVAPDAFLGSEIKTLWLQGNRLTFLPEHFLLELNKAGGKLVSFPLSNNEWQCGCLLELIAESNTIGVKDYYKSYFTGLKPSCVSVSRTQLQCKRPKEEELAITLYTIKSYLEGSKLHKACFY